MQLSLKVCTMDNIFSWLLMQFPCFLCSEIHLSKMAILMFRNDFLKNHATVCLSNILHCTTHIFKTSSLYFTEQTSLATQSSSPTTKSYGCFSLISISVPVPSLSTLCAYCFSPRLWTGEETWAWIIQTRVYTRYAWSMDIRWTWRASFGSWPTTVLQGRPWSWSWGQDIVEKPRSYKWKY